MININFGDYDLIQTTRNEFKKVFHENTQGTGKTYFLLDEEIEIVKSIIEVIENSEDSDEKIDRIQYLESEFFS